MSFFTLLEPGYSCSFIRVRLKGLFGFNGVADFNFTKYPFSHFSSSPTKSGLHDDK